MPKCAVLRIQDVEPKPTFSYPEGLWMGDGQGACRTSALENSKVLFGNFSGPTCSMTQVPLARKTHLSLVPSKTENQDGAKVLPLFSKEPYRTFTSQELDPETGLYYYGARYYDPRTSVWQSADPELNGYLPDVTTKISISFKHEPVWKAELSFFDSEGYPWRDGGVFNSTNLGLYTYVGFNPLIYIDPDGKASVQTDMTNGTTTFDARPEVPNATPEVIHTQNRVDSAYLRHHPHANDAFSTRDIGPQNVAHTEHPESYGPDGAYIHTGDPNGRDIHGGGHALGLAGATAPHQSRLVPTLGCTRGYNQDVQHMRNSIVNFQHAHPGVRIPYSRSFAPSNAQTSNTQNRNP